MVRVICRSEALEVREVQAEFGDQVTTFVGSPPSAREAT